MVKGDPHIPTSGFCCQRTPDASKYVLVSLWVKKNPQYINDIVVICLHESVDPDNVFYSAFYIDLLLPDTVRIFG